MESSKPTRLPKISIRDNRGSIQIRFRFGEKNYQLSGLGQFASPVDKTYAESVCSQIKLDIIGNQFDYTLDKYRPSVTVLGSNQLTLKDIWERYKLEMISVVKLSVQTTTWNYIDKYLDYFEPSELQDNAVDKLVYKSMKRYSSNTLDRWFRYLSAASQWALKSNLIDSNPWLGLYKKLGKLPPNKRAEQYYSPEEIRTILKAFRDNRYLGKSSRKDYKHSDYANFIEFLFLTGCRPQDALGLTYEKIKSTYILFDVAYTRKHLGKNKTDRIRKFPINQQLEKLIGNLGEGNLTPNSIVFANKAGNHLDLPTVSRNWRTVVYRLVQDGLLSKYLPLYSLRNSAITLYSQLGVLDKDLARMMDTSTEMIDKHYKGIKNIEDIRLPEL